MATRTGDGAATQDGLTLQEAADRAGVHYMTVYRWVRTSRLPASKEGGRWVVARTDLDRVVAGEPDEPVADRPATPTSPAEDRLRDCLVSGDGAGSLQVVEEALAGGMDPETVHLELIPGAMRQVGAGWARGELTIADEHRASAAVHRLLGALAHHFNRPGRRKGTVLIGAPAGDHHGLPLAMLNDPLRGRGYDVIDLGADLPAHSFAHAAAAADRLVSIGIHASVRADVAIEATIAAIRDQLGDGVPILVGGTGVADAEHARRLGADRFATTPADALERLTELA